MHEYMLAEMCVRVLHTRVAVCPCTRVALHVPAPRACAHVTGVCVRSCAWPYAPCAQRGSDSIPAARVRGPGGRRALRALLRLPAGQVVGVRRGCSARVSCGSRILSRSALSPHSLPLHSSAGSGVSGRDGLGGGGGGRPGSPGRETISRPSPPLESGLSPSRPPSLSLSLSLSSSLFIFLSVAETY